MIWLWVLLASLVVLMGLYKFIEGNEDFWQKQGIYSVRNKDRDPFWARLLFRIPIHRTDLLPYQHIKKNRNNARIAGITSFRQPMLYIMDLDLVRNVLVKDFDHFVNRINFDFNDPTADLMLINQENQEWKKLRSTMTPTFSTGKIKRMFGVFHESGKKMVAFLKDKLQKSTEVEIQDVCGRYALDVIAGAAFGVDSQNFENANSPFVTHARLLHFNFNFKFLIAFTFKMIAPKLAKLLKFSTVNQKAVDFLESVVRESIRRRKDLLEKPNDFLQLMLEAQNDLLTEENFVEDFDARLKSTKTCELTDTVLIAQCNLFFSAGFDAVEGLLMWTAYELALNPEIQERLYQELREATLHNDGKLDYDTVVQLKYLDMVISETLRKYPTGIRLERRCNEDFNVPDSNQVIKNGTHVIVPIYAIHHDPELYPNPDKYDPERFNAENKAARHPFAYLPFGTGPRSCIAMRFAIMEGKAAMAHLFLNFRISPCSKTVIPMKFSNTGVLKPENGLWVDIKTQDSQ